ncbi:NADP-dependent oxidoreductase [Streptomyces cuspidosporus]|uniref:NADP-dependent oxidoreductase n=1 Tax=Streptomyces cuspidosporus TaxID=66882 RepID=A0ABN3GLS2_9ACTN
MPVPAVHREVRLAVRPRPARPLSVDHFEVVEVPVPEPGPGQLLVRNRVMAVTAVMRTLMNSEADLFMPPYVAGEALWGLAVGEVVAAPGGAAEVGELVEHRFGWREYAVVDAAEAHRLDPEALPDPAAHLSQGPSAWMGVVRGAEVRSGDTVFVTGAAGGVGSLAGQIARLRGAKRVIGSTGSPRKAEVLTRELGYDAVVLRGAGPIEEQLREAAPDGLDAVFDNVGGEQLRAALALARRGARFAIVGALSGQATGAATAPVEIDTVALTARGITLRGIALYDHMDVIPEWTAEFGRGLRAGTLTFPHVRLSGVERGPRALCELLEGRHVGAVLVDL